MGMDGLLMANTGALKESTSADFASRSEQIAQAESVNNSRQVQTTATNRPVREKDEEEQSGGRNQSHAEKQEDSDVFEDGLVEEDDEQDFLEENEDTYTIEDIENPNKDFYVKLNAKDDIIELYDSATDRLIETISGNELRQLVCKLNMASGIFINKKV